MSRFSVAFGFLSVAVLAGAGMSSGYAQVMVSPAFTKQKPQEVKPAALPENTLTLHAAAEPDPALRYRFWPSADKRRQGNPMPFVNRAVLLSVQAYAAGAAGAEFSEKFDKYIRLSIDELPKDEVRNFVNQYGGASLSELRRCENMMRIEYDLDLDDLSAPEIIATILPEFQEMRQLARLLHLRARLAIAEERWDDFVADIRLGFRLAEIAGRSCDFLVGRLVGYAISGVMMGAIEEAIQRPGCPNLYWALAAMPETRLDEIRAAIELESVMISRLFRDIGPLPRTPIGAEAARVKLQALVSDATETLSMAGDKQSSLAVGMMAGFYVVTMADPSRKLLSEHTDWGDRALKLSAPEAVLRGMQLKYERIRDDWAKWALLPVDFWNDYQHKGDAVLQNLAGTDVIELLVMQLTPAVDAARKASRRTIQNRNYLLTIEALRMHAAAYGKLPKSIEKLQPVPTWPDGLTRKQFGYVKNSDTSATLTRHPRRPGDKNTMIQIQLVKDGAK